jgi:polyribonucleotide nucleotidyltransferase
MRLRKEIQVGQDALILETGKMAKQADGACVTQLGQTVVLTTACMTKGGPPRPFLPLTVDYRENTWAGGRIPGGFFKREGRPTEKEIITCRMIDRPVRPLFPDGYYNETQIVSMVLSADGENDPDILAINGASAALTLSGIPFYDPIAAIRVGLVDGEMVFNPGNNLRDVSDLDLIVVGTEEAIVMVEAGANQVSEEQILDCIFQAHEALQPIIRAQHEMFRESGLEKPVWEPPQIPAELEGKIFADLEGRLKQAFLTRGKMAQKAAVDAIVDPYMDELCEEDEDKRRQAGSVLKKLESKLLRDVILDDGQRLDGRRLDEIRPIMIEAGLLPRTHGSALFTRGETQALVTVTLGTRRDAQIIEEYEGESLQKFLLHYNFPPFSVGEVRFMRGPGRREIGHGVLARRSVMPLLPHEDDFAYTVRVVSDILESNGSSSMATVCGSSLALFDAGVPMLAPVAGVAMGLVKEGERFAVLSDIQGLEDHHGDMDFKVAGTGDGITALQMDIKIGGISRDIMQQALSQARQGRLHILGEMQRILDQPREEISRLAPRLYTLYIPKEKIRDVIGPGGKTIRAITEETGCSLDIEDDGKVVIGAPDEQSARRAREIIDSLTAVPEVGKVYKGQVRRVEPYGAFVEIMPGTDGLLHISEMAPYRVAEVTDIVKEGDSLEVKVISMEDNRVRLSRKAVIMDSPDYDPADYAGMDAPDSGRRGDGDRRGGRGDRDRGDRGGRGGGRGRGGRGGRSRSRGDSRHS